MELFSSNVKKILIFSQKKAFPIFLQMKPCTFYPKLKKYHLPGENCYASRNENTEKLLIFFSKEICSYISGNFLNFRN